MTELEKAADTYSQFAYDRSDFDLTMLVESAFKAGAQWAFQNRDTEKVLCAACYFPDGNVYSHQPRNIDNGFVVCGWRHHNCISLADLCVKGSPPKTDDDVYGPTKHIRYRNMEVQGFLTSKGNFVDRTEAAVLAYSAGQIADKKDELYSEDLY